MTQKELQHIAPTLAKIQKQGTGYSIPKGYFDKVEATVSTKLFVDALPKKAGHEIPVGYFEQVENTVISKLEKEIISKQDIPVGYFDTVEDKVFERLALENKPKVVALKKYWIPAAIAASLLLLVSVYNPFSTKQNLQIAEIEEWIGEGNLELDPYEIAELYSDEINNLSIDNTINTDDIEDYLKEDISEESFYN